MCVCVQLQKENEMTVALCEQILLEWFLGSACCNAGKCINGYQQ